VTYCDEYDCVSVCLFAKTSPEPRVRSLLHFCACCLSPWLGPPPASLRYVMYFRFCGWHHVFSERELTFTFAVCYRPSVCRLSSVTFVHPTFSTPVEIFGNILRRLVHFTPLTFTEMFTEIVTGNPSVRGFKRKKGSQI